MDEAEDGSAVLLAKQSVVAGQALAILSDFQDEGGALFDVVMQMHFHVADSQSHHLRDAVENIPPVLFLRVEKAVLGALARGVTGSVVRNARPPVAPPRQAAEGGFNGGAHAQRFVVIGDGDPGALRLRGPHAFSQAVLQVRKKPDFCMSREVHGIDLPFACPLSRRKAPETEKLSLSMERVCGSCQRLLYPSQ